MNADFTPEEDDNLIYLVNEYGRNWKQISAHMKGRSRSQCRERWKSYLEQNSTQNSPRTNYNSHRFSTPKEYYDHCDIEDAYDIKYFKPTIDALYNDEMDIFPMEKTFTDQNIPGSAIKGFVNDFNNHRKVDEIRSRVIKNSCTDKRNAILTRMAVINDQKTTIGFLKSHSIVSKAKNGEKLVEEFTERVNEVKNQFESKRKKIPSIFSEDLNIDVFIFE